MSKLITLVALSDGAQAGRAFRRGEVFETSPVQAAVLIRTRKVRFARALETLALRQAEADLARPSRRYRRRDLVAEP